MPFYEYLCPIGHKTSLIRPITLPLVELEKARCSTEGCLADAELIPSKTGRPILIGPGFHQVDYQHGKLGS